MEVTTNIGCETVRAFAAVALLERLAPGRCGTRQRGSVTVTPFNAMGSSVAIDFPVRLPQHWLGSTAPKGKGPKTGPKTLRAFVNSVMSYTKMDVPTVELFETAVTFDKKHSDPLSAHQCLSRTFGKKAGISFVFRADTGSEGRYWVYSGDPWLEPPAEAVSALAPK